MSTTSAGDRLTELGERYFTTQHSYDPYNATLLGLNEFDALAGDPSEQASSDAAAEFSAIEHELADLDPADLGERELLDRDVLGVLTRGAKDDAAHSLWAANASAKSYISRQGLIFQAVPAMTIADDDGADRYLTRLSGIGGVLTALGERYAAEASSGGVPTAIGVQHAITQLEGYLALPPHDDALLKPTLGGKQGEPGERAEQAVPAEQAVRAVRERALSIVANSIRPAMAQLADRLRVELLPVARDDERVGINRIPGGEAGYLAAVARHTTTALTPQEIHQIGLDTLDELRPRWSEIGGRALGETDFARIAERMRSDPSLRFETSEQIVAVAEGALQRAEAVRDRYFPHYDLPDCVIEQINPIDAENTALAYYRPPAVDGSRPGAHCLLATDPPSRYSFEYECLAFHESVPGHHLQLATAQTLDIPRYRRYLDAELCAFNEGWGLYSEQLADEIGLYSDDIQRLGMLSFSALRACRLVVDTGIHHLGWSRRRAIEFMWQNTATTEANVRNEVDRYIAWPGQALAYVVGKREIVRLRALAEQSLGDRFSIADFHGVVLGSGAVPLSVLAGTIDGWRTGTNDQTRQGSGS